MSIKKYSILRWFQIRGNNLLFLLASFLHFFQQFRNQRKILSGFDTRPIFKFCDEKVFRSYKHFFEILKPYSQEKAQNIEKHVFKKCLRLAFFAPIYPWTSSIF